MNGSAGCTEAANSDFKLSEADFRRIVHEWNDTAGAFDREARIHDGFECRAADRPDSVAVVSKGKSFTYREINERANRLAHFLKKEGIAPGKFVGVCLKRTEEMIVAVLAVVKAGGAYAPLDASYPKDRLAFMIEDTKAPLVLTQSDLRERLPADASRYLCVDQLAGDLADESTANPAPTATADDRAYVIYTSGSTGKPKGVLLRHRPVVNVLDWVNQTFGVTAADRLLFVTSLSFDLSVYDIFGILGAGGSIRVATEEELRNPGDLLRVLNTEPITVWDSAPAALSQLVPFFGSKHSSCDADSGKNLRLVMLSGDWIPVTLPDTVREVFPNAVVMSLGGATEAAIWSNWYPIGKVDPKWPSIPYGKPIRNARYHVLDERLNPVPVGVTGELFIGGEVLADGYLNRPELTAERFIPDPFLGEGHRLYRTGDLARYFPDGNIEFLGRIDNQVKVRGYRVETGEIEATIAQIPGVQDVVVKPHKDASGENYLVGYVVARQEAGPSQEAILTHLQKKLPSYMLPSHVVNLDSLPLTPNGKVDRAALKPPESKPSTQAPYEEPVNATELKIAAVWARVLGVERVGRNDHFFQRGGHSLRAAQAVARLQLDFDIELRVVDLFGHPTVVEYAEVVHRALRDGGGRQAIPRQKGRTEAPASLIQQRFWFLDRNIADRTIYNVSDAIRITGPLNLSALRKAWQAVLDKQDSLRTTFQNVDGWPEQVVNAPWPVSLALVDLSGHADPDAEARRLIAEDARQPFDVANGPLWRARVLKTGDDNHLLTWTIHHVVIDESSRAVLLADLWDAYDMAVRGKVTVLPELEARYLDYSLWQRSRVTPDVIEYWKKRLHGAPPPIVPPHPKARPAQRNQQGSTVAFKVPAETAEAIGRISRDAGVTPYIAWLAAFQTMLFRQTGQADVCVGSPVTTRPPAAREILGCFINTLVLRTDLSNDPTFRDLLGRARETLTGAMNHGEMPFEKLVEELKPERTPGGHPFFQSLFIYHGEDLRGKAAGHLDWRHEHLERVGAKFDFTLTIEDLPTGTTGYVEFAHDLYDDETVRRYIEQFLTLAAGIGTRPEAKLSELPILPAGERDLLLYGFNETDADYPTDLCVHQLVEAQAACTPDAVAFEFKGKTLTFRELNERANRLAHHLRSQGVKPDTLVSLCVERSLDMPVAMLGILKSGGAYLPLDPDFPPDRLSFYLSDSKSPIIVAHGHLLDNLPVEGLKKVRVDDDAEAVANNPSTNPGNVTRPGDLMYVLYTSGSTGRPNGVAVQHQSLVNLFESFKDRPGLRAGETIFSITTLSFDIHTVETWLPMVVGAKAVIVPRDAALDGQRLADMIREHDASVMQSTPATWRLLVTAEWKGKKDLRVWCGGEPLTAELHQQLTERVGELWNVYGPTETTVWSVIHKTRPTDRVMYIGKPVANTQIYLLDPQRRPVPLGCVGEIWIAGDGLARGYLGREELTTARFLPDPFSKKPGNRMYKTGDLGRVHPNGDIECLGRVDHQVKVRGFRIELNEIERVLEEHEGVAQAVVTARTDDEFSAMIHAYYRCEAGHAPTPADLRKFGQGRLPDYMVPATFTKLDAFPQTPNGKVDRKALPAPTIEAAAVQADRVFVPPANDAERALLAIWEEVLGIKPLSVTDDFHEVGGHSLLAAVLMSRIESRLGHKLSIEVLFASPTVRSLAEVINKKLELGSGSMVTLQTGGSKPPLFLVAGVGGHVFAFHKFARLLGPDYPVYGMKAIGINGTEPPLTQFEDIAARYVKEILAENPDGPYVLGGYSVGGRIAMEVALQLQALGKQVPRLVVVDMFAPGFPKPLSLPRRVAVHALKFLKLPWNEKWNYARERTRKLLKRVNAEVFKDVLVKDFDVVPEKVFTDVAVALMRGNEAYKPVRKYKGKVVLVQSDVIEEWEEAVERVAFQGWGPWSTEPVEEHTMRAAHLEMFKDHVQPAMANVVRKAIDEAAEEVGEPSLSRY